MAIFIPIQLALFTWIRTYSFSGCLRIYSRLIVVIEALAIVLPWRILLLTIYIRQRMASLFRDRVLQLSLPLSHVWTFCIQSNRLFLGTNDLPRWDKERGMVYPVSFDGKNSFLNGFELKMFSPLWWSCQWIHSFTYWTVFLEHLLYAKNYPRWWGVAVSQIDKSPHQSVFCHAPV